MVGQMLCANFQLTQKGRNNVETALLSLSAVGSLGDALYFGLGVEDLVRSLATTEEGAVCLLSCHFWCSLRTGFQFLLMN